MRYSIRGGVRTHACRNRMAPEATTLDRSVTRTWHQLRKFGSYSRTVSQQLLSRVFLQVMKDLQHTYPNVAAQPIVPGSRPTYAASESLNARSSPSEYPKTLLVWANFVRISTAGRASASTARRPAAVPPPHAVAGAATEEGAGVPSRRPLCAPKRCARRFVGARRPRAPAAARWGWFSSTTNDTVKTKLKCLLEVCGRARARLLSLGSSLKYYDFKFASLWYKYYGRW